MKPFVGYTRRPEPKWPYVLMVTVIIFIFLAFVIIGNIIVALRYSAPSKKTLNISSTVSSTTSSPTSLTSSTLLTNLTVQKNQVPTNTATTIKPVKEANKEIVPPGETKVEKIFFTSKIDATNQPTDKLDKVTPGNFSRLYCYTKIISHPPQTIHHVWIRPDGEVAGAVTLYITNNPAYTWSYIGLGKPQVGKYRVLVKDKAGKTLAEKSVEIAR